MDVVVVVVVVVVVMVVVVYLIKALFGERDGSRRVTADLEVEDGEVESQT